MGGSFSIVNPSQKPEEEDGASFLQPIDTQAPASREVYTSLYPQEGGGGNKPPPPPPPPKKMGLASCEISQLALPIF